MVFLQEDNTPYEKPDDDLCVKIVEQVGRRKLNLSSSNWGSMCLVSTQVEFYFSDANITRDKFLLKHVRRNKEGFVSLKLVASFKRVKHLTKDWRQASRSHLFTQ